MAILKTVLEEPLLSRQQSAVLREIARAAHLNQGLIEVNKIADSTCEATGSRQKLKEVSHIIDYLKTEIDRVLSSIKVPANPVKDQGTPKQVQV